MFYVNLKLKIRRDYANEFEIQVEKLALMVSSEVAMELKTTWKIEI